MNHPPNAQIDEFGVWGLELDVGFLLGEDFQWHAVLGHTDPGDAVCWGDFTDYPLSSLEGFLHMIHNALSLGYRPVVIFFDWKVNDWGDPCPFNDCDGFGKAACEAVFGEGNVLSMGEAINKSVPELAGKMIFASSTFGGPSSRYTGDCTNQAEVEGWFRNDSNLNFFRIDQYQGDWTFDIGAPPNPLVVDTDATPPWRVTDSVGDDWFCPTGDSRGEPCNFFGTFTTCDFWKGQVVHEQGTYRFPYKTVGQAVKRAEGITPTGDSFLRSRCIGYGWTVLIRPGNYLETLTINIPLTLKKDDRFPGTVIIG
jgi:hypothetical protein